MGFNLGFNWKGLDFSVVANGAFGQQIVQSYRNHTSKQANYTTAILGRWTGEGTSNRIPLSLIHISATDSEPFIGVSVQVRETATGGITDIDGRYSVSAQQGQTLVFSYIGYQSQEIKVGTSCLLYTSIRFPDGWA